MRRTIMTIVLMMSVCIGIMGQEKAEYKKALRSYFDAMPAVTSGFKSNQMKDVYKMLNQNLMTNFDEKKSNIMVDKYFSEQMMDDFVEIFYSIYKSAEISVEDLNTLTAISLTPDGKTYQQHLLKLNEESMATFQSFGMLASQSNISVKDLEDLTVESNIPSDYLDKFDKFYVATNLSGGVENSFNALKQQLGNDIVEYMKRNTKTLYINEGYKVLTMDDLDFGIKMGDLPAFKKQSNLMNNMADLMQSVGMSIVTSYVSWMKSEGVSMKM